MVKLWKGGWVFMKRARRDGEGEGSFSPTKEKQAMTMMELDGGPAQWRRNKARRGFIRSWNGKEHHTISDTLSLLDSTDTTLGDETAAWRVENILSAGPPIESDWWEEESCSSSSPSSSSLDVESVASPPDVTCTDSSRSSSRERRVRFRNVGYLTWQQVQRNWKSSGGSLHGAQDSDPATQARAPTPSTKRELVKGLANNRQYEMKHRVRLADLLAIYNEMWTEEWSE